MEKLPHIYASPITKKLDNFQNDYRSSAKKSIYSPKDINKKIDEIFASKNHVYKSKVNITLPGEIVTETIVGKTSLHLLTMDGKLIKISDIIDISKQ